MVTGSPPNDPNAGSVQTVRCKVLSASPFFPSQPHPAGCPHWHQNAAILASPWHDDLARSCKHKSFLVRPGLKLHCMWRVGFTNLKNLEWFIMIYHGDLAAANLHVLLAFYLVVWWIFLYHCVHNIFTRTHTDMCVCNIWIDVKLPSFFFPLLPF